MYGEIAAFYEIAVHFFVVQACRAREGHKPLPYAHKAVFLRKTGILQHALVLGQTPKPVMASLRMTRILQRALP